MTWLDRALGQEPVEVIEEGWAEARTCEHVAVHSSVDVVEQDGRWTAYVRLFCAGCRTSFRPVGRPDVELIVPVEPVA